jgi:hypothetical protein
VTRVLGLACNGVVVCSMSISLSSHSRTIKPNHHPAPTLAGLAVKGRGILVTRVLGLACNGVVVCSMSISLSSHSRTIKPTTILRPRWQDWQ